MRQKNKQSQQKKKNNHITHLTHLQAKSTKHTIKKEHSYLLFDSSSEALFFSLTSSESYLLKYLPISTWFKSSSALATNVTEVEASVVWDRCTFSLWGENGTLELSEWSWGNCSWLIRGPSRDCCCRLPQGTGIRRWSRRNKLSFVHRLFTLLICSIWNTAQCSVAPNIP